MANPWFDTLAYENPITPPRRVEATPDHNAHLLTRIDPSAEIDCPDAQIGVGVVIEAGVRFRCKKLVLGDFCYVGRNCTIITPEFRLGDYSRMNEGSKALGRKHVSIGRNVYLGAGVYLDGNGGLTLEDNTLAGAYSMLWTHVQGGDLTAGGTPKLRAEWPLVVRKDAWLVGRVVVSHAREIGARAVVLAESNVLKDVPADTTWAGNPAKDITETFGRQFYPFEYEEDRTISATTALDHAIHRFEAEHPEHAGQIVQVAPIEDGRGSPLDKTYVSGRYRTYTKRRTAAEVEFIRWCLAHDAGKFVPVEGD